jgi:hypothetical protein
MAGSRPLVARRLALPSSIAAGVSWLAWELSRLALDDGASSACATSADYFNDTSFAIANMAAAVVLLSFATLQPGASRWIGFVSGVGAVGVALGNSAEHCVAEPFFVLYVAGSLGYLLAGVAFGGVLLVSGRLGRWPGPAIAAAAIAPLMLGYERGGAAIAGIAWLALAAFMMFDQRSFAPAQT